ncbi:hypothetical protein, partial [Bacteroides caecimuris]|uniref:hypothetical protein n=1 Tax=Bacteroides caecimuris TaxID=1796613 RepID=UPI002659DB6A
SLVNRYGWLLNKIASMLEHRGVRVFYREFLLRCATKALKQMKGVRDRNIFIFRLVKLYA